MDKKFFNTIQKRVIDLLLTLSNDLQTAAQHKCSEISRLVGCWILSQHPTFSVLILKGEFEDGSAHDVLGISSGEDFLIIDPTVWQIFPQEESIFVGEAKDMSAGLKVLSNKYGGMWKLSEELKRCSKDYEKELLSSIRKNC